MQSSSHHSGSYKYSGSGYTNSYSAKNRATGLGGSSYPSKLSTAGMNASRGSMRIPEEKKVSEKASSSFNDR